MDLQQDGLPRPEVPLQPDHLRVDPGLPVLHQWDVVARIVELGQGADISAQVEAGFPPLEQGELP